MVTYELTITDEVNEALRKVSEKEGKPIGAILNEKVSYYVACDLHRFMGDVPFNTMKLSISERLEVFGEFVNNGIEAANEMVNSKVGGKK